MNPPSNENETTTDEEGLRYEYDVVVCGTGLVQSILACALSRAGKTILHVDCNDYYGEFDSVMSIDQFQQYHNDQTKKRATPAAAPKPREDNRTMIPLSPRGSCHSLRFHDHGGPQTTTRFPIETGSRVKLPHFGIGKVLHVPTTTSNTTASTSNSSNSSSTSNSVVVSLYQWTLADGTSPKMYIGIPDEEIKAATAQQEEEATNDDTEHHNNNGSNNTVDDYLYNHHKIMTLQTFYARALLLSSYRKQQYVLDVCGPKFIYASGNAVNGLITSNVAQHLEFKTIQALYWLPPSTKKTDAAVLQRVPCSKSDIFQTSLLKPMEKRRFMKFLQLLMDYTTSNTMATEDTTTNTEPQQQPQTENEQPPQEDNSNKEEVVESLNERQLNQGRSLSRPQNKVINTKEIQLLKQLLSSSSSSSAKEEGKTNTKQQKKQPPPKNLDSYLEKQHKLSPFLRSLIQYTLALREEEEETSDGGNSNSNDLKRSMDNIGCHLTGMGHYGTTAFLTPLYGGSGELSQFFCRSSAIFGSTYLLRRIPHSIRLSATTTGGGSSRSVRGVELLQPEPEEDAAANTTQLPTTKTIRCKHVIVSKQAMLKNHKDSDKDNSRRKVLLRRVSVVLGRLIPPPSDAGGGANDNDGQRVIVIIPPSSTIGNSNAIHATVLDESVHVTPKSVPNKRNIGTPYYDVPYSTMIHLSTIVDVDHDNSEDDTVIDNGCLEKALQVILRSFATNNDNDDEVVKEIYRATFSYDYHDDDDSNDTTTADDDDGGSNVIQGLHVVNHRPSSSSTTASNNTIQSTSSMTVDWAFSKAQDVFESIMKDNNNANNSNEQKRQGDGICNFLELSQEMKDTIMKQQQQYYSPPPAEQQQEETTTPPQNNSNKNTSHESTGSANNDENPDPANAQPQDDNTAVDSAAATSTATTNTTTNVPNTSNLEQYRDIEEDDERYMLQSAMDIINK